MHAGRRVCELKVDSCLFKTPSQTLQQLFSQTLMKFSYIRDFLWDFHQNLKLNPETLNNVCLKKVKSFEFVS